MLRAIIDNETNSYNYLGANNTTAGWGRNDINAMRNRYIYWTET